MQLQVNGDNIELDAPATLVDLISHLALGEQRVAVEVNGDIVPRGEHAKHQLQSGDKVEIVRAIGGG